ncbi:MAG: RNase adapter RapZ [Mobilibacterium timonense]|uniref:RNase adapter RapZ n=1 Tax=Mobilibacterium timonense TaxID=1871012 RepID=UPI002357B911|nr:RNase adapter RapZ [Mobilibacterium timonense]MBM6990151.1 RNase adapter RapZ [Mobilibacterium timonense]
MKVVIISGMSGAGKTKAADWFEDQGYYCIDNMPPALVSNFLELTSAGDTGIEKAAFVADLRGKNFFKDLETCIDNLRKADNVETTVLFIEASTDSIVHRYNETRRQHPLTGGKATREVIEKERQELEPIRKKADVVIDTTKKKVAEFNMEMNRIFLGNESGSRFNINITSFGYKYGIPTETDMTFDMRFIPNPFYVNSLRELTGNNRKVSSYVMKFDITKDFISQADKLINTLIPGYIKEGKYHLNIAFGCTGGHHRSVAVANEMARIFEEQGYRVTVNHRDLGYVKKGAGK